MRKYRYTDRFDDIRKPQLQLDSRHRKVAGVCAGLARYLGVQRVFVRIAAVIALILIPGPTLLTYAITYLLLDKNR